MKNCPFCKEEIKADAIKCKHCQTMLVPTAESAGSSNAVTYVVDQGLLRFGKFATALLAVFVTVGVVLYSVDLEKMGDELDERAGKLDSIDTKIQAGLDKLKIAEGTIEAGIAKLKSSDDTMSAVLAKAKDAAARADALVADVESLRNSVVFLAERTAQEREPDYAENLNSAATLLDLVKQLPDERALELVKNPPPINPKLKELIASVDPGNTAATQPDAARRLLSMIVAMNDRDELTTSQWRDALAGKATSP